MNLPTYEAFQLLLHQQPRHQRKMRKIVTNNKTGDVWAVTIPHKIIEKNKLKDVYYTIKTVSGGEILILGSGAKWKNT